VTPTAAQLAARRRVMDAAAQRRRPHLPDDQPRGPTVQYTSLLLRLVAELDEATATTLRTLGVHLDAPFTPGEAARARAKLQALADRIAGKKSWLSPIEDIADSVLRFSEVQFRKKIEGAIGRAAFEKIARRAVGLDLFTGDPDLSAQRDGFRAENVDLIKTLTDRHVERVAKVLEEAGSNTRVEDIAKRIREATGATKSQAALIARDQVLGLNADVARARHEAAGITQYVWRTSHDERVREGHRELDGKVFSYDRPPMVDPRSGRTGNPGEDFQCRCVADPLIEGFDEAVAEGTHEAGAHAPIEWSRAAKPALREGGIRAVQERTRSAAARTLPAPDAPTTVRARQLPPGRAIPKRPR